MNAAVSAVAASGGEHTYRQSTEVRRYRLQSALGRAIDDAARSGLGREDIAAAVEDVLRQRMFRVRVMVI